MARVHVDEDLDYGYFSSGVYGVTVDGYRPRIAMIGRFTDNASALRYRGVVSSRALLEIVWAAGSDPLTLLPGPDAWTGRPGLRGSVAC